ncbi:MAG: hypothetical protein ACQSGP_11535 [Frankia sp.]
MEVTKQTITDVLSRAGLSQQTEQLVSSLPDPVDADQAAQLLGHYGITRDMLIDRIGGSP